MSKNIINPYLKNVLSAAIRRSADFYWLSNSITKEWCVVCVIPRDVIDKTWNLSVSDIFWDSLVAAVNEVTHSHGTRIRLHQYAVDDINHGKMKSPPTEVPEFGGIVTGEHLPVKVYSNHTF